MGNWVLRIEVNGEWEQCSFPTQKAALLAFAALAKDYRVALKKALLIDISQAFSPGRSGQVKPAKPKYLN
jgi:hypothetical protein